ncbi:hypothetical protein BH18VER1_BH18VER1_20910 [soil metagenome]
MKKPRKNSLECSVFAVSAALILGIIGFLGYESATIGDRPPAIEVEIGKVVAQSSHFAVPITVRNKGDQTAEGVQIELLLRGGGGEERGQVEVQFLPRRGTRNAWVTFKSDPRSGTLEARVLGYEQP